MEAITTADQLLVRYDSILHLAERMLSAAREDNWDTVIELQARYSALADTLRPVDASIPLDDSQRVRKHDLTRRILSNETAVRELAAPRLARLSALLESGRHTRALHKTYGLSAHG
ncbi:flagellar protein FliT [Paraburkholderia fungorum]|uniref:flagellar protein FliT n=1 Tax=Paraburkholderia fungorum TaxID=134537 RepID=UPI0038B8C81C